MQKFMCALLFMTLFAFQSASESEAKGSWQEVYKKTARAFVEKHIFPDGERIDEDEIMSGNFAENEIALCDVNNDGKPELLIAFQSGSMASKLEYVCGFNEKTGKLTIEYTGFPAIEFFDNGCLKELASHNQGLAGEFWPYSFAKYNPKTGKYEHAASVDAWSKEDFPTNPFENDKPFPDEIDKTGDGFVYFIDDENIDKFVNNPVDTPSYKEWEKSYIGNAKVIKPDFLPANKKGLNALNKAISQQ